MNIRLFSHKSKPATGEADCEERWSLVHRKVLVNESTTDAHESIMTINIPI